MGQKIDIFNNLKVEYMTKKILLRLYVYNGLNKIKLYCINA